MGLNLVNAEVVSEEYLAGTEIPGGGGRGRLYLTLFCQHQNDFCVKMGCDESRLNVSFAVTGKLSHKAVSTDHNF